MKTVPKTGGNGGIYCIDITEITNDQYTAFWGSPHSSQGLPGVCASKISFTPKVGWPPGPTEGLLPVAGVDWCDAYAYCAYFGKHLCGKVSGGANTNTDFADATKSEWYNACTAQGANDYPYGGAYSNTKCHGVDQSDPLRPAGTCATPASCAGSVAVTSNQNATCLGGVPGVLGMSGNVAEWENSCDDAVNPTVCRVRGGSHCETGQGERRAPLRRVCDAACRLPRMRRGLPLLLLTGPWGEHCAAPHPHADPPRLKHIPRRRAPARHRDKSARLTGGRWPRTIEAA